MLRPDLPFLFGHPFHFLACGLGSGLSPFAPGTVGTLAAWALYPLVRPWFGDAAFLVFLALAFAVGVLACDRTGRSLGVADHGAIVWDEMVPFWAVLFFTPPTPAWQALAFLLFRGFDILKPPPADWIDAHLKNGLGVMLDDVVAGLYTLVALAVIKAVID
ncbi:MAG: phosphatidylglycerophosphatase A [Pseudomonadota bacterium]